MEPTLSDAIADYIEHRKQTKLEPLQKALNKVLVTSDDEIAIAEAKVAYTKAAEPIEAAFKPDVWLTDASEKAKRVNFATHVPKYTHSGINNASSILVKAFEEKTSAYLVTTKIKDKTIDTDVDAAALFVATLLRIEADGESLISQLKGNHIKGLVAFTNDPILLNSWFDNFKLALVSKNKSSHTLSKQLYFPVKGDEIYHLLCPLFSSTLSQKLYEKVVATRNEKSKEIRGTRRVRRYHEEFDIAYPNIAVQKIGGANTQNVSQLNVGRFGQSFLLNAAPPKWQTQAKPPVYSSTLFNRQFTFRVGILLREFKTFLTNLKADERNFKVRYKRDYQFILPIIDELMNYAVSIQNMPGGWSLDKDRKLKVAHALWLDVFNPAESFQREREKGDWLPAVAADFASWLSRQLKNDEHYKLSESEHVWFEKLCLKQLQRFERTTPKLGDKA
jgi:CRISPR-associated protein Csy1